MKNKLWVLVLIAGAIAIYYFTKGDVNEPGDPAGEPVKDTIVADTTNVAPPEPAAVTQ